MPDLRPAPQASTVLRVVKAAENRRERGEALPDLLEAVSGKLEKFGASGEVTAAARAVFLGGAAVAALDAELVVARARVAELQDSCTEKQQTVDDLDEQVDTRKKIVQRLRGGNWRLRLFRKRAGRREDGHSKGDPQLRKLERLAKRARKKRVQIETRIEDARLRCGELTDVSVELSAAEATLRDRLESSSNRAAMQVRLTGVPSDVRDEIVANLRAQLAVLEALAEAGVRQADALDELVVVLKSELARLEALVVDDDAHGEPADDGGYSKKSRKSLA